VDEVLVGTIVASTLRVSVPLILCALAGVLCERAGVIDLGLEGKMLPRPLPPPRGRDHRQPGAGADGRGGRGAGAVDAARLRLRQPPRRPGRARHGHHDDGRRA
jgi:hypothetical protein